LPTICILTQTSVAFGVKNVTATTEAAGKRMLVDILDIDAVLTQPPLFLLVLPPRLVNTVDKGSVHHARKPSDLMWEDIFDRPRGPNQ
jgi:hypothetical protein